MTGLINKSLILKKQQMNGDDSHKFNVCITLKSGNDNI